jgi:hypothetical protein
MSGGDEQALAMDGVAVTRRGLISGNLISGFDRAVVMAALIATALAVAGAETAHAQIVQPVAPSPPVSPAAAPPSPPQTAAVPAATTPATPAPADGATLPPQPPPVAEKRGFLNDFGAWWDKSVADFNAKIKGQQSKLDDFNNQQKAAAKDAASATQDAMKNAADAMVKMATPSHVVEMQEVCPLAGNGAPDCATAALNVCHAKGYKDGQPVDIRTAEKCTSSLWVSGQPPASGDCPLETIVLRSACQ